MDTLEERPAAEKIESPDYKQNLIILTRFYNSKTEELMALYTSVHEDTSQSKILFQCVEQSIQQDLKSTHDRIALLSKNADDTCSHKQLADKELNALQAKIHKATIHIDSFNRSLSLCLNRQYQLISCFTHDVILKAKTLALEDEKIKLPVMTNLLRLFISIIQSRYFEGDVMKAISSKKLYQKIRNFGRQYILKKDITLYTELYSLCKKQLVLKGDDVSGIYALCFNFIEVSLDVFKLQYQLDELTSIDHKNHEEFSKISATAHSISSNVINFLKDEAEQDIQLLNSVLLKVSSSAGQRVSFE